MGAALGLKWKLFILLGLIALLGLCLAGQVRSMAPVQEGNSHDFWFYACRVKLNSDEQERSFGEIYQPRDGWFIYYKQGFHGQVLFRVEPSVALADFPLVVEKLRDAPADTLPPLVENGFKEWTRADPSQTDAPTLLEKLREARLDSFRQKYPDDVQILLSEESEFDERWERVQRYPLNWTLEFFFFTVLILWAGWPWLRGLGSLRWAIHFGSLPILFFLPYLLGYARISFTSAGPGGGVLYPWLLIWFRHMPWTRLDTAIMKHIPQILEPLNQPPGPMWSLSFHGGVGPIAVLVMGIGVGLGTFFLRSPLENYQRVRDWFIRRSDQRK
jgi:hypothetical protein